MAIPKAVFLAFSCTSLLCIKKKKSAVYWNNFPSSFSLKLFSYLHFPEYLSYIYLTEYYLGLLCLRNIWKLKHDFFFNFLWAMTLESSEFLFFFFLKKKKSFPYLCLWKGLPSVFSVSLNSMQWVLYHCSRITSGSSVTPNSFLSALRFATALYLKLGAILSEYYFMCVTRRFVLEPYEKILATDFRL